MPLSLVDTFWPTNLEVYLNLATQSRQGGVILLFTLSASRPSVPRQYPYLREMQ